MEDNKKISDELIPSIIADLMGTCGSLSEAVSDATEDEYTDTDLSVEQLEMIDQEIFLCADCGWWCEISEEANDNDDGDQVCEDCMEMR